MLRPPKKKEEGRPPLFPFFYSFFLRENRRAPARVERTRKEATRELADQNRHTKGAMKGEAWRRRAVVLLVFLGAVAAASIVCTAGIALHRNRTTDVARDDDAVEAPATGDDGCRSIVRAHRCKSRCGCEWCPPGPGFGCHEVASGARGPCGGRDGHRRAFWTCEAHLVTWLAIVGAALACAAFVGVAVGLWICWPRMCRTRSASIGRPPDASTPLWASKPINA